MNKKDFLLALDLTSGTTTRILMVDYIHFIDPETGGHGLYKIVDPLPRSGNLFLLERPFHSLGASISFRSKWTPFRLFQFFDEGLQLLMAASERRRVVAKICKALQDW